jgi:hypothetical protein
VLQSAVRFNPSCFPLPILPHPKTETVMALPAPGANQVDSGQGPPYAGSHSQGPFILAENTLASAMLNTCPRGKTSQSTSNQKAPIRHEKAPINNYYGRRRPWQFSNFRPSSSGQWLRKPRRLRISRRLRIPLRLQLRSLRLLELPQRLPLLAGSSRAGSVSSVPLTS